MISSELARMRADIAELLWDVCDIFDPVRAADVYGGYVETWVQSGADVPCRMDHKTGQETLAGGAIKTYQGNVLTLAYNSGITTANRVRFGGQLYNVLAVSEGSDIAVRRVTVERVGNIPAIVPDWYGMAFSLSQNSIYTCLI